MSQIWGAWPVFKKEMLDAARDRKTLVAVLLSSLIVGPLVLGLLSTIVSRVEAQAERREVMVAGGERAPGLLNHFARQGYKLLVAPPHFEDLLRTSKLAHSVVVVPQDYAPLLENGEQPTIEVVSDSSNRSAQTSARPTRRLVEAYSREQGTLALAVRGVSPQLATPLLVEDVDLANTAARGAQLTGMLPFFVMMAVLYGALNAALDTTAGERERGSLEPLLANPASRWGLVMGKWGAVATVSMSIAVCSVLSFYPSQLLLQSETLAALFQFGLREGLAFIALLLPFAAALSAALMAVAIRCKTFKEAQASATFLILGINMLPLVSVFDPSGEKPWHLWVPGLGQQTTMMRVLKGEPLGLDHLGIPLLSCTVLCVLCLMFVQRTISQVAAK